MRKIIGIGETIFDIIFKNGHPTASVPGGSTFNSVISLGRAGIPVDFISETGNDHIGQIILDFMQANGVNTDYVQVYPDGKSAISLAFLDEDNNAQYIFYKDYPACRLDIDFPTINSDDIVIFGSYFALNPVLRNKVVEFLGYAQQQNAIIYYDVNFRSTHSNEVMKLTPAIIENMEYADIVRGSNEDFFYMYHLTDPDEIYRNKVAFYCPNFICTHGDKDISLRTPDFCKEYKVPAITPVSTIGAGDNFNAGIVYGLICRHIHKNDLNDLTKEDWNHIIHSGISFSTEACMTLNNSVSRDFIERIQNCEK